MVQHVILNNREHDTEKEALFRVKSNLWLSLFFVDLCDSCQYSSVLEAEKNKRWPSKLQPWLVSYSYSSGQSHWKPARTSRWPNKCWPVEYKGAKRLAQGHLKGSYWSSTRSLCLISFPAGPTIPSVPHHYILLLPKQNNQHFNSPIFQFTVSF